MDTKSDSSPNHLIIFFRGSMRLKNEISYYLTTGFIDGRESD